MNFRENDADRFLYVLSVFLNAFYALYKDAEAVYRCLLFLHGQNGGSVHNRGQFWEKCTQSWINSAFPTP